MPISEKTVELNVSRAVVEKMRRYHQIRTYSLGTSQTEEQMFGLDVEITDGTWSGGCIQYKRLKKTTAGDRWDLNHTTNRDQQSLLCTLQKAGFPVYYCLPKFDDESVLQRWSPPPIWEEVWWIPPLSLKVPKPVNDHHHLLLRTTIAPGAKKATKTWWIYSENGLQLKLVPTPFEEVEAAFMKSLGSNATLGNLKSIVTNFAAESWHQYREKTALRLPEKGLEKLKGAYFSNLLEGLGFMAFSNTKD